MRWLREGSAVIGCLGASAAGSRMAGVCSGASPRVVLAAWLLIPVPQPTILNAARTRRLVLFWGTASSVGGGSSSQGAFRRGLVLPPGATWAVFSGVELTSGDEKLSSSQGQGEMILEDPSLTFGEQRRRTWKLTTHHKQPETSSSIPETVS